MLTSYATLRLDRTLDFFPFPRKYSCTITKVSRLDFCDIALYLQKSNTFRVLKDLISQCSSHHVTGCKVKNSGDQNDKPST